ncbi:MAG: hypothetical protein GX605_11080 [Chloroflexi bacterium]|nr:hypothetical protein [Chloroflexota bacterium]
MDVHLEFPRDLSPTEVAALARVAGLALGPDDLVDVTHRLNATLGAMAEIDHPDLESIAPLAVFAPGGMAP